ncbi:hypothetical protein [Nocardioides nitrophenolicus]|uniref:hypothetical protein n=1 Tax=Nocardioides nitrophenolicus TaxID=60489 RepID=UPI00195B30C2|nr:hypothetical protein [Nocardioides nitrophenolicus]MBM7517666.1 hypothetical protein [Nocardioides nitrophenolicus]
MQDLAFEVGDGDGVALDDHQDLLEAVASVDLVVGPASMEVPAVLSFLMLVPGSAGCHPGAMSM